MTTHPPGSASQNRNKIWLRGGVVRHFARMLGYLLLIPFSLALQVLAALVYAVAWLILELPKKRWARKPLGEPTLLILLSLLVLLVLTIYGPPCPSPSLGQETVVVLDRGLGVRAIAGRLKEAKVISSPGQFLFLSKLLGVEDQLQAGKYSFAPGTRPLDVLSRLTRGQATAQMVTIPEGLTIRQMARLLQTESGMDAERFIGLANDPHVCREHGVEASSLEGYLFPDTYGLYWGIPAREIIALLVSRFQHAWDDSMARRAGELGMSLHQVITLASMIEEEVMANEERPIISAVYHNRLKKRMLLQCDPTVIYALGGKTTPLTRRDLKVDSPYNTYRHRDLPPGPISNPGKRSIMAALYPAKVDYLYFVARGDGSHHFSHTHREHVNAKNRIKKNLGG
jgi:UPF0755 protein